MYDQMTTQEQEHKSFFYPKETMGTTIMAIKYDGGVIAVADSRIVLLT
jgi:20S proteasome alpha/beta subunit